MEIINKYVIINELMTWNEAEIFCNNTGTSLSIIHSIKDYQQLIFLCSMYQYDGTEINDCWIGLKIDVSTEEYLWIDQTDFNTFHGRIGEIPLDMNGTTNSQSEKQYVVSLRDDQYMLSLPSEQQKKYFVCNIPSELCTKKQWLNFSGFINNDPACEWEIDGDNDFLSVIHNQQWMNGDQALIIQYVFKITVEFENDGYSGIVIFNEDLCQYIIIGIMVENEGFYVFIGTMVEQNDVMILQQNLLRNQLYTDTFFAVYIEITVQKFYNVVANDDKEILYVINGSDVGNEIKSYMSGYIGIYDSGLSTISKSLYISESKISVDGLTQSKIDECYVGINNKEISERQRLFHLDGSWGYLLAFVLIVFAYCVAVCCVCLLCPWSVDNLIRRKWRTKDAMYNQIFGK